MNRQQVIQKISGVTLLDHERLNGLEKGVKATKHLSGDMAEFGVYKGGSAYFLHWCNPAKVLHLFDTFSGCPEDDVFTVGHKKGDFDDTNLEKVDTFLGQGNYCYHVGYFPDTAKGLDVQYSFVHVDCDLKKGVQDAINYFWPRMVPGGIMSFDDFGWKSCPGVQQVLEAFFTDINYLIGSQASVIK